MRQLLVRLGILDDGEPLGSPLLATLIVGLAAALAVFLLLRALGVPFEWPLLGVVIVVFVLDTVRRSRR